MTEAFPEIFVEEEERGKKKILKIRGGKRENERKRKREEEIK